MKINAVMLPFPQVCRGGGVFGREHGGHPPGTPTSLEVRADGLLGTVCHRRLTALLPLDELP